MVHACALSRQDVKLMPALKVKWISVAYSTITTMKIIVTCCAKKKKKKKKKKLTIKSS